MFKVQTLKVYVESKRLITFAEFIIRRKDGVVRKVFKCSINKRFHFVNGVVELYGGSKKDAAILEPSLL